MKASNMIKELLGWVFCIAGAVVIGIFLNIFVFQITPVEGNSMKQTLHNGDIYITSKLGNLTKEYPQYGDIVVIDSRVNQKRTFITNLADIREHNMVTTLITGRQSHDYWVKRVIGLPGDTLHMADGVVSRNGDPLEEDYVNPDETPFYRDEVYTVPEGYLFVMGDNRNHSADSRIIGPVPVENVIGKVKFRLKSGE